MISPRALFLLLSFFLGALPAARAHESRPGYLGLAERQPGEYDATWKQPANGTYAMRMGPQFPAECRIAAGRQDALLPGALVSHFHLTCPGGLMGRTVIIAGLETTLTDVLVRLHRRDGTEETHLARPVDTAVVFGGGGPLVRAGIYLRLGMQHIVMGLDHLLFVLGLVLIVRDRWMLVKTISAFTVAHSLTLAAATLGWASVPAAPLNFAIALSILFLAPEIVRVGCGESSLTIRHPWLVAFVFGLLHGFGFASGLVSMGLPRGEIPLALLLFNTGVEIGQLGFVLLILALLRAFRLMELRWPAAMAPAPAYVVGTLGALWSWQRFAILIGASS